MLFFPSLSRRHCGLYTCVFHACTKRLCALSVRAEAKENVKKINRIPRGLLCTHISYDISRSVVGFRTRAIWLGSHGISIVHSSASGGLMVFSIPYYYFLSLSLPRCSSAGMHSHNHARTHALMPTRVPLSRAYKRCGIVCAATKTRLSSDGRASSPTAAAAAVHGSTWALVDVHEHGRAADPGRPPENRSGPHNDNNIRYEYDRMPFGPKAMVFRQIRLKSNGFSTISFGSKATHSFSRAAVGNAKTNNTHVSSYREVSE